MKRGDIWTLQDDAYASKPRPVVIVQGNLDDLDSVILCLLTSFERTASASRVRVDPDGANGLNKVSYVMADKLLTVRKGRLGDKVGELTDKQMHEVSRALASVLQITYADLA
jgi:mRNA interferase MazF